jgi:hypothetical protein
METVLNAVVASEHANELRHRAEVRRANASGSAEADRSTMELRLAGAAETQVVRRLSALDDAPELEGQVLLALIEGEAVAALSLRDQRVVANPFVPTRDVVALLRLRAEHLLGPPRMSGVRRSARAWRGRLRRTTGHGIPGPS